MGIEIERKFLLAGEGWRAQVARSERMVQGYLLGAAALAAGLSRASVRVRLAGDAAWLNIKAARLGIERAEFEYPIPVADAEALLRELCDGVLEKCRHHVAVEGTWFEIDEFAGANQGLIVAEVELPAADAAYPRPDWLGVEVSALARYYNVNLMAHPYTRWSQDERAALDARDPPDEEEPTAC